MTVGVWEHCKYFCLECNRLSGVTVISGLSGALHLAFHFRAQLTLGISLYLTVIIYRLFRLYHLIVKRISASGYKFWLPIVLSWVPSLLCVLLLYIFPSQLIVPFAVENTFDCPKYNQTYKICMYSTIICQAAFCFVTVTALTR